MHHVLFIFNLIATFNAKFTIPTAISYKILWEMCGTACIIISPGVPNKEKNGRNKHFIETFYVPLSEIEKVKCVFNQFCVQGDCKPHKPGLYLQRIRISESKKQI